MQLGWFACVLGATGSHPWVGPCVVLATLTVHVGMRAPGARAAEIFVLAASALLGFAVDTVLLRCGVIARADTAVSPPWLIALWPNAAAATAAGGSLAFLSNRPWLAACLGGVAGAVAYGAGSRMGAIGLGESSWRSLGVIGVAWACVLPIFFWLRASRGRNAKFVA